MEEAATTGGRDEGREPMNRPCHETQPEERGGNCAAGVRKNARGF